MPRWGRRLDCEARWRIFVSSRDFLSGVLIMLIDDTMVRKGKTLPGLLALYGIASLVHFVHNAEYLVDYPNLPAWLSRFQIYGAWCGITVLGLAGYILYRRGP